MAAPKRTDFEHERDLEIISDQYLRGKSQQEMADYLNDDYYPDRPLSRQQIGYDVKVLVRRWRKSAERRIDERKAIELARLDRLEREYQEGYERSMRDVKSTTVEELGVATDEAGMILGAKVKQVKKTEGQVGNPAFLAGVLSCIAKRCQILGLDEPKKLDVTSGGKPLKGYTIDANPDNWDEPEDETPGLPDSTL